MPVDRRDFLKAAAAGAGLQTHPVLAEYIARRLFGTENDGEVNESFRLVEATFEEGEEDLDAF